MNHSCIPVTYILYINYTSIKKKKQASKLSQLKKKRPTGRTCHIKPERNNGFKFVKDANKYYTSHNTPGKFPETNPLPFNNFSFVISKSEVSPKSSSCPFILPPPTAPPPWGRADEAGLLFLTPSPGAHTHLIGLLERGICNLIHLLIKSIEPGRFSDRESWTHVHDIHIGCIIAKHLPKATERVLSTWISDGRGGRQGCHHQAGHPGLMTHLACLLPGAQPTRTPQCPRV